MNFENSIIVQKKLFEEYSQGVNPNEIEWIRKRIIEAHPDWKEFEDKDKFEYYVLFELNLLLSKIQHDKSSDIRPYVKKQLKIQSYLSEVERLRNLVLTI